MPAVERRRDLRMAYRFQTLVGLQDSVDGHSAVMIMIGGFRINHVFKNCFLPSRK